MSIVLHIDMDYFFAQIEERENPQFKGKPIIVGADPREGAGRGVVSTCNYEARKFGVKSGMPISRSYKLIPKAIYLPVNMELYKKVSDSIFKIIRDFSEIMEEVSLDEAYIDLTEKVNNFEEAEKIGLKIKEKIFQKEELTCSVGIAKNKMIAKITCELAKPNGLRVTLPEKSSDFLSSMDITVIPGIGAKTKQKIKEYLKKEEVKVSDARAISKKNLKDIFGKRGDEFYFKFRGEDRSIVEVKKKAKSIGREYTFQKDTKDSKKIIKVFKHLISSVSDKSKKDNVQINGVVITCRFEDFETHTKQKTFSEGYYDKDFLYKKSIPLLLKFLVGSNKKVRLIGFRVKLSK